MTNLRTFCTCFLLPVSTVAKASRARSCYRLRPSPARCSDAFRRAAGRRCDRLVEGQGFHKILVFSGLLAFGEVPVILGFQKAAWAQNLKRVGAHPKHHSDVAVLRIVYARGEVEVGHVRKECPCEVQSSEVQHVTLRDEVRLFWCKTLTLCNVLRDS